MQKVTDVDTPFGRLARGIKRNPVVVGASVRYLEWRCRSVRSFAFVASTGRSGTTTLARLFEDIPSCVALHEPYPAMTSDYATDSADDAQLHRTRFQQVKRIQILRAASNLDFYLETNHQFLKNFASPGNRLFRPAVACDSSAPGSSERGLHRFMQLVQCPEKQNSVVCT